MDVTESERSLGLSESIVQLAKSFEEESSLLLVDIRNLLDHLGGVVGSALEVDGGGTGAGHGVALLPVGGLARVSMSGGKVENLAERLAGLGGALGGGQAIGQILGEALGGGVVLARQVDRVFRELLVSCLGTLLGNGESRVLLSEHPQNVAGNLHSVELVRKTVDLR